MFEHHKKFFHSSNTQVNTDGISMFKSSRLTIWQFTFKQLTYFRYDNILTCGLWVGQTKPSMDILLSPVLQQIDHLNATGFSFLSPEGMKCVRVKLLFGVFDLIAKASVLNMKQFNGSYGCPTCLHPENIMVFRYIHQVLLILFVQLKGSKEQFLKDKKVVLLLMVFQQTICIVYQKSLSTFFNSPTFK